MSNSFIHNNTDKHIYSKFIKNYGVIICLYVDDLLIFGANLDDNHETKKYLTSKFKMNDPNKIDAIRVRTHSYNDLSKKRKKLDLAKWKQLGMEPSRLRSYLMAIHLCDLQLRSPTTIYSAFGRVAPNEKLPNQSIAD